MAGGRLNVRGARVEAGSDNPAALRQHGREVATTLHAVVRALNDGTVAVADGTLDGPLTVDGALAITDTTPSADSVTGALTVAGGVGIGGAANIGGALGVTGGAAVSAASGTAFTVTNTGTGDSFVVNDAAGDATPFVIDAAGNVVAGYTATITASVTPGMQVAGGTNTGSLGLFGYVAGVGSVRLILAHSRGITPGAHAALANGDTLGRVSFEGSDGSAFVAACAIVAEAQGAVSPGVVPGNLRFYTANTSGTLIERLAIDNAGAVSAAGKIRTAAQLESTVATGTAPLVVSSTTAVANLNADLLDGNHASAFLTAEADTLATVTGRGATTTTPIAITAASASDALRVTQTGAGNALVIEDSANPDATPFVIDKDGVAIQGHTAAISTSTAGGTAIPTVQAHTTANNNGFGMFTWATSGSRHSTLFFGKSLSATIGSHSLLAAAQPLGTISWAGSDGAAFAEAARITAYTDTTPALNDMSGRIVFATSPAGSATPTERARITSTGSVLIGTGTDDASALLNLTSTARGLLLPRLTTAQRDAISAPTNGLLIYNTTVGAVQARAAGAWVSL